MFNKPEPKFKKGDEEIISKNLEAEVPYELVAIYDANGNKRLFTRNIRDGKSDAERKQNIANLKMQEALNAQKVAQEAALKLEKSQPKGKVEKNEN